MDSKIVNDCAHLCQKEAAEKWIFFGTLVRGHDLAQILRWSHRLFGALHISDIAIAIRSRMLRTHGC